MSEDISRGFTDHEAAIIRMAIDTMSIGREEALAQMAVAKHGGLAHEGSHPCFTIDLPEQLVPIPTGSDYPLTLWAAPDQYTVGSVELFIENGRLDSLDWSEVSLADDAPKVTELPSLDRLSPTHWPYDPSPRA